MDVLLSSVWPSLPPDEGISPVVVVDMLEEVVKMGLRSRFTLV